MLSGFPLSVATGVYSTQRRRAARIAPRNHNAETHDAVVMTAVEDEEPNDVANLRGELSRAAHFADTAVDEAVKFHLRELVLYSNIDPGG